jgi:hypothetical protein
MANKSPGELPPIPDHSAEFGEPWHNGPLQAFTSATTTVYISPAAQARIDAYFSGDDLPPPSDDETKRLSPLVKKVDANGGN